MNSLPVARALFLSFGIAAFTAPVLAADGKAVYDKTCAVCHAAGVANAPKFGDKAAWGPRLGAGVPALVGTVIAGKGAMPPKGGAANLQQADIQAAVEYMVGAVR